MKAELQITAIYKDKDPVIVLEQTVSHPMAANYAFQTAQKLITKLVDATGSKMPLVKLKVTIGTAPRSMNIFRSAALSGLHYDVFLFGNLNLLDPARTRRSASYSFNNPDFAEEILPILEPVHIPPFN